MDRLALGILSKKQETVRITGLNIPRSGIPRIAFDRVYELPGDDLI